MPLTASRAGCSAARLLPLALAILALAAPAYAQSARDWLPPQDSLPARAAEAQARFRANARDSVGGENYRAYEIVGLMARRMLRAMGPQHLLEAPVVADALDSLGLDTEVAVDPAQPGIALLMVRNPYRLAAGAVGFLFWWKGDDLRLQGAEFRGGLSPAMRAWWTGKPDRPWQCAVLDRARGAGPAWFTLFRMSPAGTHWSRAQDGERNAIMGTPGEAVFADINRDGTPEVVHWAIPVTDSLFIPCADCPRLVTQDTYVERREGFVLEDSHLLASGYAAFVTFVRRLLDKDRAGAARLLRNPADVTKAVADGWSIAKKPGTWRVEYVESSEPWPRWMEVRFDGPQGPRRYVIRFGRREDKWIVEDWVEPRPRGAGAGAAR